MTDHQHAADAVPDGGTPSTGADGAAGESPPAHVRGHGHTHTHTHTHGERGAAEVAKETGAVKDRTAAARAARGDNPPTAAESAIADSLAKAAAEAGAEAGGGASPGRSDRGGGRSGGDGGGAGGGDGAGGGNSAGPGGAAGAGEGAGQVSTGGGLRRDRRYKMIAGVCAGLGREFDMDPVVFRITLAVLSATGGIGLIFYGFAWLLVPYSDEDQNEMRKLLTGRVDGHALAAVLFALVGCGVFLSMLDNASVLTFGVVLSLLLAGAGYWSRHRDSSDPDPLAAQAVADAPPEAQAPPVPVGYPSWWRDPIVKDGTHYGGTGYLWGPGDPRGRDISTVVDVGPIRHQGERASIRVPPGGRPPVPRGPRWTGGWVFLLAVVACGIVTRLAWDEHPLGTSLQAGLAAALIVLGAGMAISSLLGRTGAGSVFLAIVTAGLLAAAATLPKDIGTHWIDRTWRPATVAEVRDSYELGTGYATLDLSGLDVASGRTVSTSADVGAGRLRVILPPDVTVKVDVEVGLGDIQLPGEDKEDVDVEPGKHRGTTLSPTSGTKKGGTLDLDLRVGVGQAEVSRATS